MKAQLLTRSLQGVCSMTATASFHVNSNRFAGTVPYELQWLRAGLFHLDDNYFAGSLPGRGMCSMTDLRTLGVADNGLSGTLPEYGLRSYSTLTSCRMQHNRFSGSLPDVVFEGWHQLRPACTNETRACHHNQNHYRPTFSVSGTCLRMQAGFTNTL
eukprot:3842784-Amphidinium_carterae.1